MNTAVSLAPRLAITRLKSRDGGAVLDVLAVLAFTVSTWLALTVAGGTWMFRNRAAAHTASGEWGAMSQVAELEVQLALVACGLLVVPILGLGGAAARLGARGRSRRLASLRLLGMTGTDVVSMSLVETLIQAAAGIAAGSAIYLASLPAWQLVSFQGRNIVAGEMLVPWWLGLAVGATVLVLAGLSTVIGLQRVRISPLGVSRNETPRKLHMWRLGVLVVAAIAFFFVVQAMDLRASHLMGFVIVGGLLAGVVGAINLVGPFVLQFVALPFTRTGRVPQLLAMRRITDDPRAAWRNVSAVALIALIAAFFSTVPDFITGGQPSADPWENADYVMGRDIRTGIFITLIIGLVLVAVQVLITQASGVFDRASESVAMDRMGMPRSYFSATRRAQVLMPLVVTLVIATTAGLMLALPFFMNPGLAELGIGPTAAGLAQLGVVAGIGIVLTFLAAEACRPLQARVLGEQRREND
ncbi:MAG TPA: hypothetical protein GX743_08400 [Actinomycetales bacterium]|nr:hypothetical protein [Actinomycetales bacterium]